MSRNVFEWCWDWYGSYSADSQTDPLGPSSGEYRLLRGGAWRFSVTRLRPSAREDSRPGDRSVLYGFRLSSPRA